MSKHKEEVATPHSAVPSEEEVTEKTEGNGKSEAAAEDDTLSKLQKLEEKIKELEEENSSLKDQYLRKTADFENFRKRMFREKEEAIKYANSSLLLDIITVIDDFERAIRSGQEQKDFESFFSGIELIERQFVGLLERNWGLKRFDSVGQVFDTDKHEAIAKEELDSDDTIVLEDYQKGYMLQDRVLRHAKVKVSVPVQTDTTNNEALKQVEEQNG